MDKALRFPVSLSLCSSYPYLLSQVLGCDSENKVMSTGNEVPSQDCLA